MITIAYASSFLRPAKGTSRLAHHAATGAWPMLVLSVSAFACSAVALVALAHGLGIASW